MVYRFVLEHPATTWFICMLVFGGLQIFATSSEKYPEEKKKPRRR